MDGLCCSLGSKLSEMEAGQTDIKNLLASMNNNLVEK